MRRKFIKYLLVLLFIILALFTAFAVWTWYQMHVTQSLHMGVVRQAMAVGGLVIPQTAVLYGVLAGFFLLITIVSIWFTYRLVMFPPEDEEE